MNKGYMDASVDRGIYQLTFIRPDEYNTIDPTFRDALNYHMDQAENRDDVHVVLLRAKGSAFCAGYNLDWAVDVEGDMEHPSRSQEQEEVWDSIQDLKVMEEFVDAYMRLWHSDKPTIAAVQGWCVGGGMDLVLCSDFILASEDASFGYPPSRVWGIPTTAMWVYRLGLQTAKRYLFTGDEIPGEKAEQIGLVLETVACDALDERAQSLARRMSRVPVSQLTLLKRLCNHRLENMGLSSSRLLGTLFDGIARHTKEGLNFVRKAQKEGFRKAVEERDEPFGDYGAKSNEDG